MDIMNVYVIIGEGFTKDQIVKDIIEEGYRHNFCFLDSEDPTLIVKEMAKCDEVWWFGNCDNKQAYKIAKDTGKDLWKMG